MASASCTTLFCSLSHFLLLVIITMLIQHSESSPHFFNYSCPDNVYNGPLSSSQFNQHDEHCGGPCVLTCDANRTMIKCTKNYEVPAYRVLDINPRKRTIAIEYPDWWMAPDALKRSPCLTYSVLSSSFPNFQLLSLKTRSGENETFFGCPAHVGDVYNDPEHKTVCGYGDDDSEHASVYGPYYNGGLPPETRLSIDCMPFLLSPEHNLSPEPNQSPEHNLSPEPNQSPEPNHSPEHNLSPEPNQSPEHNHDKGKLLKIILLLVVVLSVIAVAVLIVVIIYRRRRRNSKSGLRALPSRIMSLNHTTSYLEEGSTNNGVTVFSYAELQEVTNNFDPARELGEGGFGVVYHGKLKDGREVAVKRMFENNYKRIEQFKNEIQILTNVRHPNLVTLYGSTSRHSRELLLVYEYIPNGTLADHLHGDQSKSVLLLWPTRLKIAIQTASALCYLHHNDIIHRDIKSNNILLEKSFVAKVADFGLSRLFPSDVSHVSTAPQGTPGYLDPEYHQCYHLTDRSDVYSFGVLLVELISSMEAVDLGREREEVNLANYAMNRIRCCEFGELVDFNLGFEKSFKVRRMTSLVSELAFRCLQHERESRPSMEEVLEALKRIESIDYDGLEAEEMG